MVVGNRPAELPHLSIDAHHFPMNILTLRCFGQGSQKKGQRHFCATPLLLILPRRDEGFCVLRAELLASLENPVSSTADEKALTVEGYSLRPGLHVATEPGLRDSRFKMGDVV